jgi:hypothetical protein
MCEETRLGRWFASPNVKLGFLDYLLARAEASGTEPDSQAVLKAISWLKENEERRRYYFERDGDDRYTGASLLRRLWPWGRADRAPAQEKRSSRPEPGAGGERARESGARQERARNAAADEQEETRRRQRQRSQRAAPPPPPRRPHLLSPHEILGVPPNATPDEIYRQFCRLAVRYHPDKVHHLGAEFQAEAHRRFVALQRAYETLRRHERGGR